ncbi:MAG: hypothetical protein HGA19_11825 [Oscillochloris sp.]|nr:hypothetical protein [Oscillochloris sp.]
MLLAELRQQVLDTARKLMTDQLVHGSQGNVSAIDRTRGLIAITPSASDYATMTAADITVITTRCYNPVGGHNVAHLLKA